MKSYTIILKANALWQRVETNDATAAIAPRLSRHIKMRGTAGCYNMHVATGQVSLRAQENTGRTANIGTVDDTNDTMNVIDGLADFAFTQTIIFTSRFLFRG